MGKDIRFLCLANSDKHENRCVAGLDLDTGEWIRPVSQVNDGRLFEKHYITEGGYDPNPLDILQISLIEPDPEIHQPENWQVADKDWLLLDREPTESALEVLRESVHSGPELFGDTRASINLMDIKKSAVDSSLSLIKPERPQFYIRERAGKSDQVRTVFKLDEVEYELPVTDPMWKRKVRSDEILSDIELQYEPASAYVESAEEILYTVSLGSPHEGACYKLIASIIPISDAHLQGNN